jgi:hypothetical protein
MPIEALTYAALGARLKISPKAARSLAKRLHLPCTISDDGKALVSVDLAEIHHTPRPPSLRQPQEATPLTEKITALEAEIARLGAQAAGHRADFVHERERADRLLVELLQANAEMTAARETLARLEGSLRSGTRANGATDTQGLGVRRLGHLAADLVAGDRKASR